MCRLMFQKQTSILLCTLKGAILNEALIDMSNVLLTVQVRKAHFFMSWNENNLRKESYIRRFQHWIQKGLLEKHLFPNGNPIDTCGNVIGDAIWFAKATLIVKSPGKKASDKVRTKIVLMRWDTKWSVVASHVLDQANEVWWISWIVVVELVAK